MAALISINYSSLYIGGGFSATADDAFYLALYQVAAKVQEMLCVASLSTVVLQVLRNELLADGVPIGLLGSGIWFSQISFVWSPEFLVAVGSSLRSFRKLRLCIFILLTGILAVVIGPASAVLLIPRIQTVPAGGTSYFLNGTAEQLWPRIMTSDSQLEVCKLENSTKYAVCPSSGHESLRSTFSAFNYTTLFSLPFSGPVLNNALKYALKSTKDPVTGSLLWFNFQIQSPLSLVPAVMSSMQIRGLRDETAVVQPHAATIISQTQLLNAWLDTVDSSSGGNNPSLSEYKWGHNFIATGWTANPWVRARCAPALNLSANATQAWFPYLYRNEGWNWWADEGRLANLTVVDRNESQFLRAQWTPLPIQSFGIMNIGLVTSGLLLEFPWSFGFRTAVGCSVSAAWHNGTVTSDTSLNNGIWMNHIGPETSGSQQDSPDASVSNQPVTLDKSWLDLLMPPTFEVSTNSGPWVPNTLESILLDTGFLNIMDEYKTRPQRIFLNGTCEITRTNASVTNNSMTDTDIWNDDSCGKGTKYDLLETIIASMVADGLSRYGSERAFNIQPDLRDWTFKALPHAPGFNNSILSGHDAIILPSDPSLVVQNAIFQVEGYAYYASSTSDYLATSVACIYIIIAGAHAIWILCYGVTSSSWHTVTELLILCFNSPSVSVLKSASAGVRHLATYNKVMKVRMVSPPNTLHEPRVVLLPIEGEEVAVEKLDQDILTCSLANGTDSSSESKRALLPFKVATLASNTGALSTLIVTVHPTALLGFAHSPTDDVNQQNRLSKVEIDKKYN
ncbi:hypothetical protein MMC10_001519 [Thelotrema lepadinum]|nr:hypothetical protein [Thelotrema lepadinum]